MLFIIKHNWKLTTYEFKWKRATITTGENRKVKLLKTKAKINKSEDRTERCMKQLDFGKSNKTDEHLANITENKTKQTGIRKWFIYIHIFKRKDQTNEYKNLIEIKSKSIKHP